MNDEDDAFDKVQLRRADSKSNTHGRGPAVRSQHLQTRLFFCGVCGGRMTGNTYKGAKGIESSYYVWQPTQYRPQARIPQAVHRALKGSGGTYPRADPQQPSSTLPR